MYSSITLPAEVGDFALKFAFLLQDVVNNGQVIKMQVQARKHQSPNAAKQQDVPKYLRTCEHSQKRVTLCMKARHFSSLLSMNGVSAGVL